MNENERITVCQETFIQVYRHLAEYDPRRSFRTWIFMILHRRGGGDRSFYYARGSAPAGGRSRISRRPGRRFAAHPVGQRRRPPGRAVCGRFQPEIGGFLTESLLVWEKGKSDPGFQIFRIENKTYQVLVVLKDPALRTFKIDVMEQNNGTQSSLLSTEAGLPMDLSTVFGFRNAQGKPYFLSLQIGEWTPPAGGAVGGVAGGIAGGAVGGRERPSAQDHQKSGPRLSR